MKKAAAAFLAVFSMFLFSGFLPVNDEHDQQLVGIWKGSEKNREHDNTEKHWVLQRFENGKYIIMFSVKQDCDVETLTEKGQWWTKDGKYYERSSSSKFVDLYNYEVKDKKVVNFKSIELNGERDSGYNFSDFKVDLD